jgi:sulfite reductase alpha subunit-like flavoprotein
MTVDVSGVSDGNRNKQQQRTMMPMMPYLPGDVMLILPQNSKLLVDHFISLLPPSLLDQVNGPHSPFTITSSEETTSTTIDETESTSRHIWPSPTTLHDLLSKAVDLTYTGIDHDTLYALSSHIDLNHSTGLLQFKKLLDLVTPAGAALYEDYVVREKRSIVEVLYDFAAIRENVTTNAMTIEDLLGILKPMQPREYSISSSPTVDSKLSADNTFDVELCVAIKKGTTKLGRKWIGAASKTFLSGASEYLVWIRRGSFAKINDIKTRPVMCIGAGTGVAPLRSIVRERSTTSHEVDHLIFGCRKRTADFYYEQEWPTLPSLSLHTAFSQDQLERIYVTKVLEDTGDLVVQHLLVKKGCLFIAGGAKMASDVVKKVKELIGARVEGGERSAEMLLAKLKRSGAFAVEAW